MRKYKVTYEGHTIAEASEDKILMIEGNVYFPAESLNKEYLVDSETHTSCPWKGEASYYTLRIGETTQPDFAWYYPTPKEGSAERVSADNNGKYEGNFANFVAFYSGVEEVEE